MKAGWCFLMCVPPESLRTSTGFEASGWPTPCLPERQQEEAEEQRQKKQRQREKMTMGMEGRWKTQSKPDGSPPAAE
ncbi:hypothetical protein TESG_08233 [Trichophyton tonsurans CBS 112818]|uniref:Uncharacterized protein n=1 Tax=Trichophyton tonsurans (strain CBS 112818) TaxID=647933 RepID=F2RMB4_TRIT1|nr:hypothetical protein TESG_08233 [Trichophyton tonsurans CBS 112818]